MSGFIGTTRAIWGSVFGIPEGIKETPMSAVTLWVLCCARHLGVRRPLRATHVEFAMTQSLYKFVKQLCSTENAYVLHGIMLHA